MSSNNFVFSKKNIMIIIIGVVISMIGFLLMMGGGSDDPNVFNADEMFSFRRIDLAPIMVIGGYGVVIYGIMKKNKA